MYLEHSNACPSIACTYLPIQVGTYTPTWDLGQPSHRSSRPAWEGDRERGREGGREGGRETSIATGYIYASNLAELSFPDM